MGKHQPVPIRHDEIATTYDFAKVYGSYIDHKAIKQLADISKRNDYKYAIAYPDFHAGNDIPVGHVMKTGRTIYFDLIGPDIGCMVSAQKLGVYKNDYFNGLIVPAVLGVNIFLDEIREMAEYAKKAFTNTTQIPSIGGGNHFLEFAKEESGEVWLIVHSGSRSLGGGVYKAIHNELRSLGLTGVNADSILGQSLLRIFNDAIDTANENINQITGLTVDEGFHRPSDPDHSVVITEDIRTVHNTIAVRKDGVYHYKGASQVDYDTTQVVIPLNMRDGSLIVEVLNAKELFYGINHGAGRRLSRSQAKANLTSEDIEGINVLSDGNVIDEAPAAYKDILSDMEWMEQQGFIRILNRLKPIITVKQ